MISTELLNKDILDMSEKGFTGREVADFLSKKYNQKITRNMVQGVKWTAGKCDGSKSRHRNKNKIELSDEELDRKGLKKRKCLCCLEEKILEKHLRICETCKSTSLYKSDTGVYRTL